MSKVNETIDLNETICAAVGEISMIKNGMKRR